MYSGICITVFINGFISVFVCLLVSSIFPQNNVSVKFEQVFVNFNFSIKEREEQNLKIVILFVSSPNPFLHTVKKL